MQRIPIDDSSYVLVLTGAGVSAESGVATFRAHGGLWESHPVEQVASMPGFLNDPQLVWRFYSDRRKGVLEVEPNPGHVALAALESRIGDRMLLVTQNVDGLHQRAKSKRVVELHGNVLKTRCSTCDRKAFVDHSQYRNRIPMCELCESKGIPAPLRPQADNSTQFDQVIYGKSGELLPYLLAP